MTTELKNDRFIRALLREPVDMTPVWIMRQAGRYLPEYRQTREQAGSFMDLCRTPELACEVTLQPLRRFALDAAILFSDILTIPDAMGLGLQFVENEGPRFAAPIRSRADVDRIGVPDAESDLGYVMDAVRTIKRELNNSVPLIGFAGSPWTIATYMIEGGSSKDYQQAKGMMYEDPATLHQLLKVLTAAITDYLNAQIAAGVNVVQIFDTWGGILTPPAYREFSLDYMQQIVAGLHRYETGTPVPVILFTKGGGLWVDSIARAGCDAIGLDWTVNIGAIRQQVGDRVALQGNMDPSILYASGEVIRKEVSAILESFGHGSGHVFNLGHGITPQVDPDKVTVLVDAVHETSKQYHTETNRS
jgi:uroporphyrinogen decarboxylase